MSSRYSASELTQRGAVKPYLYSLPFMLLLICFMIVPFLFSIGISFTNYSLIKPAVKWIGLQNYRQILMDPAILRAIGRNFVFLLGVGILSMSLGIFYAITMSFKIRGINIVKAIVLLPWIIPESVTGYVWKWIFSADSGIVYYFLLKTGLIREGTSFLLNGNLAMLLVILANAWRTAPFVAIMVYAKLKSLPSSQIEAAKIDGANALQIFRSVTVPWLMPILKRCSMLLFVWSFNSFSIIHLLTGGGPGSSTTTLAYQIYTTAFKAYNHSGASALSVLVLVIIMVSFLLFKAIGATYARLIRKEAA